MRKSDIHAGHIYFDGNRSYRFVVGDAPPAHPSQLNMDNLAYVLVQMREDGAGLSGNGKGRKLSCTRASLAGWAKEEVLPSQLPAPVRKAFETVAAPLPQTPAAAVGHLEEFRQFAIDAVTHGVNEGVPSNRDPRACIRDFRPGPLAEALRAWKPGT